MNDPGAPAAATLGTQRRPSRRPPEGLLQNQCVSDSPPVVHAKTLLPGNPLPAISRGVRGPHWRPQTNSISFLSPHLFFTRNSHKATLKDGKPSRKMGKACQRSSWVATWDVLPGRLLCSPLTGDVLCTWLELENRVLTVLASVWGKLAGSRPDRGRGVSVAPREMCACPSPQDRE